MKYFNNFFIDKAKILENISNYNYGNKLCAMVKANAYGLGMKQVVKTIDNVVDFYGVANCVEAICLRNITQKSILVCGKFIKTNLKKSMEKNISITVDEFEEVVFINQICEKHNLTAKIHLKINTGMNRLGINNYKEFKKLIDYIQVNKKIALEGIFTHFSSVDCNKKYLIKQAKMFKKYIKNINCDNVIIHCANTDASILKGLRFDMVRVGIGLYENAIKVKSKVVKIQNVKAGQFVGYAPKYLSNKKIKVAVIPLGYADGIMRCYSGNGRVIINDCYYNIIGSVCMDMLFVKIDDKVQVNDEVIIIGESANCKISEKDVAKDCNTISYEILTNFNNGRFNIRVT